MELHYLDAKNSVQKNAHMFKDLPFNKEHKDTFF